MIFCPNTFMSNKLTKNACRAASQQVKMTQAKTSLLL